MENEQVEEVAEGTPTLSIKWDGLFWGIIVVIFLMAYCNGANQISYQWEKGRLQAQQESQMVYSQSHN